MSDKPRRGSKSGKTITSPQWRTNHTLVAAVASEPPKEGDPTQVSSEGFLQAVLLTLATAARLPTATTKVLGADVDTRLTIRVPTELETSWFPRPEPGSYPDLWRDKAVEFSGDDVAVKETVFLPTSMKFLVHANNVAIPEPPLDTKQSRTDNIREHGIPAPPVLVEPPEPKQTP